MFKTLFPILLLGSAIAIFYFITDPSYQDIKTLTIEKQSYNDALDNAKKLQSVRDELLAKYNAFPSTDLDRLEHMLPNNVDNVRLVLEIDRMAAKYGMSIKNIKISTDADNNREKSLIGKDDKLYGTLALDFSVDGPYSNFTSFMSDLEKSLRIVDIYGISFSAAEERNIYQYNVKIKTYWLK